MTIEKAKQFLAKKGYYSDTLWNLEDVKQTYECTDKEAHQILNKVLNSEYITSEIFTQIDLEADLLNLKTIKK